jgi:hypothetical protein
MRSRNIKQGFFTNEGLAGLDLRTRLVFIGLWLLADRCGRLEDRPKRIGAELFPYEQVDIGHSLELLSEMTDGNGAFIERYQIGEMRYIQISNFIKHQSPHTRERESEIPAPRASQEKSPEKAMPSPEKAMPSPSDSNVSDSNVSDSLIPDSLIQTPYTPLCSSKSDERVSDQTDLSIITKSKSSPRSKPTQKPSPRGKTKKTKPEEDQKFLVFWTHCHKQVGKKEAAREWQALQQALMKQEIDPDWLFDQIREYTASSTMNGEVLSPAEFLRACRIKGGKQASGMAAAEVSDPPGLVQCRDIVKSAFGKKTIPGREGK